MLDYGASGDDISGVDASNTINTNGFIAKFDAAGSLLTSVKPPWGATLPGGSSFGK
jgi:hypothetical protein